LTGANVRRRRLVRRERDRVVVALRIAADDDHPTDDELGEALASGKTTRREIIETPIIDVETGEDMRDSEGSLGSGRPGSRAPTATFAAKLSA
jgi:hypothetical protein